MWRILKDTPNEYDKSLNSEIDVIDFNKKGFPEIRHDTKLWSFKVFNNGDLPATNVKVEYSIVIMRAEFELLNKIDVENLRFVPHKTINRTVTYDYIAPNSEKIEEVCFLTGAFPYANLIVTKLEASERKFITNKILIQTYQHPDFLAIQDSHHDRMLLGAYKVS